MDRDDARLASIPSSHFTPSSKQNAHAIISSDAQPTRRFSRIAPTHPCGMEIREQSPDRRLSRLRSREDGSRALSMSTNALCAGRVRLYMHRRQCADAPRDLRRQDAPRDAESEKVPRWLTVAEDRATGTWPRTGNSFARWR